MKTTDQIIKKIMDLSRNKAIVAPNNKLLRNYYDLLSFLKKEIIKLVGIENFDENSNWSFIIDENKSLDFTSIFEFDDKDDFINDEDEDDDDDEDKDKDDKKEDEDEDDKEEEEENHEYDKEDDKEYNKKSILLIINYDDKSQWIRFDVIYSEENDRWRLEKK